MQDVRRRERGAGEGPRVIDLGTQNQVRALMLGAVLPVRQAGIGGGKYRQRDQIVSRRKFFEIKTHEQRTVRAMYSTSVTGRLPVIHSAKRLCFDRTFRVLRTSHFSGFLRCF